MTIVGFLALLWILWKIADFQTGKMKRKTLTKISALSAWREQNPENVEVLGRLCRLYLAVDAHEHSLAAAEEGHLETPLRDRYHGFHLNPHGTLSSCFLKGSIRSASPWPSSVLPWPW